jgi:Zn-dependent protease
VEFPVFLLDPPPTSADVHFRLLGIPVRVHPMFWLVTALMGRDLGNRGSIGAAGMLLTWIAAAFFAILIHELGHAAVMRWFGFVPRVTLYAFGGMAIRGHGLVRREPNWLGQILISIAGPGAGFLLGALVLLAGRLAGGVVVLVPFFGWLQVPLVVIPNAPEALQWFLIHLLYVCFFWGLLNLLPILPLDGGHIAQQVLVRLSPYDGLHRALVLSLVAAIGMAVFGLVRLQDYFLALFFGYLAFSSFQALQMHGTQRPW